VAERNQAALLLDAGEPAEPAPGDVLQEHALDGIVRAVTEDLVARGLDEVHHASILPETPSRP
jgi:hypothetical protein